MFRIFSAFILLAFFIWILPLGAFIKISQEGKVCGGQRAICLCSMNFHANPSKSLKPILTNAGQVSKESSSSGSANREFSVEKYFFTTTPRQENFILAFFIPATVFFIKSIEHVPKA